MLESTQLSPGQAKGHLSYKKLSRLQGTPSVNTQNAENSALLLVMNTPVCTSYFSSALLLSVSCSIDLLAT